MPPTPQPSPDGLARQVAWLRDQLAWLQDELLHVDRPLARAVETILADSRGGGDER